MRHVRFEGALLAVALLIQPLSAWAQEPAAQPAPAPARPAPAPAAPAVEPPKGPAEIFGRAAESRDRRGIERAAMAGENAAQKVAEPAKPSGHAVGDKNPSPSGAVMVPASPAPTGTAPASGAAPGPTTTTAAPPVSPGARDPHSALADPALPSAEPALDLPLGTIAIEVLAPTGQPYGGAEIVLGIMASQGGRTEKRGTAGSDGRYTFRDLATGSKQAYRVNVLFGGAKFSTTPFRMPDQGGYRVRVPLLATTHEDRMLFQVVGQTVVELRDDRLHITQQARLANAGNDVFVLPKDGLLVPLPSGYTAFQWQDQMTDQQGTEDPGKGMRLRGSLPPGAVTLAWAFDLEREGNAAKIPVTLPFRTYTYRVISEAPQGLELKVPEFPEPERVKDQGRDLLFTQVRRSPQEPPLDAFSIRLEGIPGPGPGRWIALALALLAAAWGLSRGFSGGDSAVARRTVLEARKKLLLDAAAKVEAEFARGDIGPEFHARRMDELTTELAMVLRDEEGLAGPARSAPASA